jgi:hypothetical protein
MEVSVMTVKSRSALVAALVFTAGLTGLTPAKAVTFDFQSVANPLLATESYTLGGITLTATGWTNYNTTTFDITGTNTAQLFAKSAGVGETGIGLVNDPTGDNEISGTNLIRIALPLGLSSISFTMGSTIPPEGWQVYGSTSPAGLTGYSLIASGTDMGVSHPLTTADDFFFFVANGGTNNVLIGTVTAVSAVPLPGALPLFASGLVGLGLLGWRRKRKNAAITA